MRKKASPATIRSSVLLVACFCCELFALFSSSSLLLIPSFSSSAVALFVLFILFVWPALNVPSKAAAASRCPHATLPAYVKSNRFVLLPTWKRVWPRRCASSRLGSSWPSCSPKMPAGRRAHVSSLPCPGLSEGLEDRPEVESEVVLGLMGGLEGVRGALFASRTRASARA